MKKNYFRIRKSSFQDLLWYLCLPGERAGNESIPYVTALPFLSASWGHAKGLWHLRTPSNPCPQAPFLTASRTLFLHKWTHSTNCIDLFIEKWKQIVFSQNKPLDNFIYTGLTKSIKLTKPVCVHKTWLKLLELTFFGFVFKETINFYGIVLQ